jgi:hypothetical protein
MLGFAWFVVLCVGAVAWWNTAEKAKKKKDEEENKNRQDARDARYPAEIRGLPHLQREYDRQMQEKLDKENEDQNREMQRMVKRLVDSESGR